MRAEALNRSERESEANTGAQVRARAERSEGLATNAAAWLRFVGAVGVALIALSCVDARRGLLRPESAAKGTEARARGTAVPAALRAAYVAAVQRRAQEEYRFEPAVEGLHAESAAPGLRAELRAEGIEVASNAGGWAFHPAASRWGCDGELVRVERATPEAEGNRATYRRRGFEEWYVNGPLGVEQGFTLPAPPSCRKAGGKGVVIELGEGLEADVSPDGQEAALRDASGQTVLRYEDLYVVDAAGKELAATLVATAGRLSVRFEDGEATYPVIVDPLWVQEGQLLATDGAANDLFGYSVAVSGDVAVVGAPETNVGAAYVFVRAGSSWSLQQELLANDGLPGDIFGLSVAVDGETAVVGATRMYSTNGTGAAYVFTRSGTFWSQQAELGASDGVMGDGFGSAVAVSGDVAIVGAANRATSKGAAYVFTRSGSSWSQQQALTANDGAENELFAWSVGLSGDTAIVGAYGKASYQGAAYVFVRSGSSWLQQQELTANDGAANDSFGGSVGVNGDTAIVGAYGKASFQGAAYVFVRSGSSWLQQQELTANDGVAHDVFGTSVAVSGDTALVGAPGQESTMNGKGYGFVRSGSSWSQQQELTSSGLVGTFGRSVALSGDTAVVGAPKEASSKGAAYVFAPSGGSSTGGAGGGSSATTGSGGSSTGLGGSSTGSGGSSTGGASVRDGNTPETPMASGCRCGVTDTEASPRLAWLGVIPLLALGRRSRRRGAARVRTPR